MEWLRFNHLARPFKGAHLARGLATIATAIATCAGAASAGPASTATSPPDFESQVGRFYLSLGLGPWQPGENSFINRTSVGAVGLVKVGYQRTSYYGAEFEALYHGATYSGQRIPPDPLRQFTMERDLTVKGFALSLRGTLPFGRFQPYAKAGMGIFRITMVENHGEGFWSFPTEASTVDPTFVTGAGVNTLLTRGLFLSVEVRHMWLKESFPDLSGERFEAGGPAALVTFGWMIGTH